MINFQFIFYLVILGIAFLSSIVFVNKNSAAAYKMFSIYLGITFFNEVLIAFLIHHNKFYSTIWHYNLYIYIGTILWGLIFRRLLTPNKMNNLITRFLVLLPLLFPVNYYLYDGIRENLHSAFYALRSILIIICCLLYILQVFSDEKIDGFFRQNFIPVAISLLLFTLFILPFLSMRNLLLDIGPELLILQRKILVYVNIGMYALFAFDIYRQWKRAR